MKEILDGIDIVSYLGTAGNKHYVIKNAIFWDVMPCGSCKNHRFGGT
jgi:hypothetical protein